MLEDGVLYRQALQEAQRAGYAEADPRLDVDGIDSAHKLAVLTRLAFGVRVDLADIPCEGIADVDLQDLQYAAAMGYTLKLLAIGIRRDRGLDLRVHPALVRNEHPLAGIGDVFNSVCIHGSYVGEVVLTGRGAGRMPTTSAVIADIARVALGTYRTEFSRLAQFGEVPAANLVPFDEIESRYYFRLDCLDQPGVLAQIAGILGKEGISIASVHQQEVDEGGGRFVPVVFMTHSAREGAVQAALSRISDLDAVSGERSTLLRVQDI
jgi:homoserine dehydrogenase